MSRNVIIKLPTLSLLVLLLVAVPSNAQGNEPFIQADVYNALYEAHVQCDDNLDQSRSEFITDMFERYRGNRVSIELLRKLLGHNVQVAKQSIADKTKERELYVSEILDAPKESYEEGVDPAEASKERHEKIRQIDDFLKGKRQYVEVHECVLTVL
jgi:hypothetical protein